MNGDRCIWAVKGRWGWKVVVKADMTVGGIDGTRRAWKIAMDRPDLTRPYTVHNEYPSTVSDTTKRTLADFRGTLETRN